MKNHNVGILIVSLLIPMAIGGVSAALTFQEMLLYGTMKKPPLSPPAWAFSLAWTILYILMGLATYFVIKAEGEGRNKNIALALYGLQLLMNFLWSFIFFTWGLYLVAFVWLLVMWCLVIACAFRFYEFSKAAAYMMIPYVLWLTFAAYLNLGAYILNLDKQ